MGLFARRAASYGLRLAPGAEVGTSEQLPQHAYCSREGQLSTFMTHAFLCLTSYFPKIFLFGFIVCLDSFMYTFTILPIRFTLAFWRLLLNTFSRHTSPLPPSQKADILRAFLLVVSIIILAPLTDASKLYHFIRGQDTIKLYVIFNALEVGVQFLCTIYHESD